MNGEKCKRPRCDERANQDGYCGMTVAAYCRDMHEVERERDIARAEVERLEDEYMKRGLEMDFWRRGVEAYRAHTYHDCRIGEHRRWRECPSCKWEREAKERRENE